MLNKQTEYNNYSSAIPTSVIQPTRKKEKVYIFGEIEKPEHALNKTYIESLLNLK